MQNIGSDDFQGAGKFEYIISHLALQFDTRHLVWLFCLGFHFLITKRKNPMCSEVLSSKQILNIARFEINSLKLLTLKFTSVYNLP